jgi:hypothetical protein
MASANPALNSSNVEGREQLMLKVLLFVTGLAIGAAGTILWILSEPARTSEGWRPPSGDFVADRVETLKAELGHAAEEGRRSRVRTEEELKRRLDAYQSGASGRLAAP